MIMADEEMAPAPASASTWWAQSLIDGVKRAANAVTSSAAAPPAPAPPASSSAPIADYIKQAEQAAAQAYQQAAAYASTPEAVEATKQVAQVTAPFTSAAVAPVAEEIGKSQGQGIREGMLGNLPWYGKIGVGAVLIGTVAFGYQAIMGKR